MFSTITRDSFINGELHGSARFCSWAKWEMAVNLLKFSGPNYCKLLEPLAGNNREKPQSSKQQPRKSGKLHWKRQKSSENQYSADFRRSLDYSNLQKCAAENWQKRSSKNTLVWNLPQNIICARYQSLPAPVGLIDKVTNIWNMHWILTTKPSMCYAGLLRRFRVKWMLSSFW